MPRYPAQPTNPPEVRLRCGEIIEQDEPDQALDELNRLQSELPFPSRAEVWQAIASLDRADAARTLLEILRGLQTKPEKKCLKAILHGMRSRGIAEADPAAVKEPPPRRSPAPKPRPIAIRRKPGDVPPLWTWVSCCDGSGAYLLAAYSEACGEGLLTLTAFTWDQGATESVVMEVDSDQAAAFLNSATEEESILICEIDPAVWLGFVYRAEEDHDRGGFPDPGNYDVWKELTGTYRLVLGGGRKLHTPPPAPPRTDLAAEAGRLVKRKEYAPWTLLEEDCATGLPEDVVRHYELPPGPERDENWTRLYRRMVADGLHAERDKVWRRALLHNARVHSLVGDPHLASVEAALAETLSAETFEDHPLTRAVGEVTPERVAGDLPSHVKFRLRWAEKGWGMLDEKPTGPERVALLGNLVSLWIQDRVPGRLDPNRVARRLWKSGEVDLVKSSLDPDDFARILMEFHLWSFRKTVRAKTVAEDVLLGSRHELPEEVREYWESRVGAVPSLYRIEKAETGEVMEIEDLLRGGRVRVHALLTAEDGPAEGDLVVGSVFGFRGRTYLVPWCASLPSEWEPTMVDAVETARKGEPRGAVLDAFRRQESGLPMEEFLRKHPQVLAQAIQRADTGEPDPADTSGGGRSWVTWGLLANPIRRPGRREEPPYHRAFQFRVSLDGIRPEIWRRIQVPESYTLWDLHVAIQDAMGWSDHHLHKFDVRNLKTGVREFRGIPGPKDHLQIGPGILPGWEAPLADYFSSSQPAAIYVYDFGDDWRHTVTLDSVLPREEGVSYPRCLDGARACPPEDCGGPPGYEHLLAMAAGPREDRDAPMVRAGGGRFDPERFDPRRVRFDDPRRRRRAAFGEKV